MSMKLGILLIFVSCLSNYYGLKINFNQLLVSRKVASICLPLLLITSIDAKITAALPADNGQPLIYRSGKNPIPNANGSKDGTKKDSNFLRCLSNCKSRCQAPSDGLAKVDCVQDCQDQCCNSYEQCSFKIKQSSNGML